MPRMRLIAGRAGVVARIIDGQRGHLFPWAPVCLGLGVGLYFRLPVEPSAGQWIGLGVLLAALVGATLIWARSNVALIAVCLILAGLALAGLRAASVAAPVLGFRYYGAIEGRVVTIDRSLSDRTRLTLDRVRLERLSPARTPARVRVSLHGQGGIVARAGDRVALTGHLSAPQGPAEPGGFDFQRHAWFRSLGAVGYTRSPVVRLGAPEEGAALFVYRMRLRISDAVRARLPGDIGAFAAAVTTGDRSSIRRDSLDALRASNLAHLLAISGLHMGLLTGFVFTALRFGLATVPYLALRWPIRKIAAIGALLAGAIYLAMSGGNVATERAFIMVAVVLVAVLLDRRALTLRAVALAAIIVLVLRPETLIEPGFQMSFAATTALIAAFAALRGRGRRMPWPLGAVGAVFVSSAVAGAATAPFGAAHFNQISHFGLLANVVSVPLMGLAVVPGAVLAGLLWPVGASGLGLAVMQPAITWILAVAETVAAWPDATSAVPAPPGLVLLMVSLGGVFLCVWQGRARWLGVPVVAAAVALWSLAERPTVLIADSGAVVGVMTAEGRAVSRSRGAGFVLRSWLENDGDPVTPDISGARHRLPLDGPWRMEVGRVQIVNFTRSAELPQVARLCLPHVLVVTSQEPTDQDRSGLRDCLVLTPNVLRDTGALALQISDGALKDLYSACDLQGQRLWSRCARNAVTMRGLTQHLGGAAAGP